VTFSYGPIKPRQPCCACNEDTKNHLTTPHGSYYLCETCVNDLANGNEIGLDAASPTEPKGGKLS
jgi:hypothetical protein